MLTCEWLNKNTKALIPQYKSASAIDIHKKSQLADLYVSAEFSRHNMLLFITKQISHFTDPTSCVETVYHYDVWHIHSPSGPSFIATWLFRGTDNCKDKRSFKLNTSGRWWSKCLFPAIVAARRYWKYMVSER